MNLRDLHYLIAVADLRSFVQAAERCFISQPTLSTQIKKVEDSLGVAIFERTNKKVLPTEIGEQIIAAARRIIKEEAVIKQLACTAHDPLAGNLRLGAFPTLSPYLFPRLVPLIKQHLPKIRLILIEEKTDLLLQQLKAGEIDLALLALPVDDDFLQSSQLFTEQFLLAVGNDHALANKPRIAADDLCDQPLLLLDEGHCLRGHALQVCSIYGSSEEPEFRATSLETLRQMVRAGSGITLMPELAIDQQAKDIHYIRFQAPEPNRSIGLVWRRSFTRMALIEQLSSLIQQIHPISSL